MRVLSLKASYEKVKYIRKDQETILKEAGTRPKKSDENLSTSLLSGHTPAYK